MQSKQQQLIQAIYAAFNNREIEAVLSNMHADVDWPNGMEGGRIQGVAKVRDYWTRQWGMMNPRVEPLRIENDQQGLTIVEVHQVVRDLSGNILVDQILHHTYTIRNGLIERMDIET
jgi:ketosteroid isomerase-like protein